MTAYTSSEAPACLLNMDFKKIKSIIESVVFSSEVPVTPGRLSSILDGLDGRTIRQAVDALNGEYAQTGRTFTIREVGGGYLMSTLPEYASWIRKFQKDRISAKLSQASLDTLAIVSFRQPISRPQIENIRGVNVDGVIKTLLERNLIRIVGRSDRVGRPLLYGTTKEFLRYFGLKTLSDLPKPKELEELLGKHGQENPGDDQAEQVSGQSGDSIQAQVR